MKHRVKKEETPAGEMQKFINKLIDDSKKQYGGSFTDHISDGYHTFKELYDHRSKLFIALCRVYPNLAWKSSKHADGTMYAGMFVAGINTPMGQATYHFEDTYWNLLDVKVLDTAPVWDGHTSDDAIERILSL